MKLDRKIGISLIISAILLFSVSSLCIAEESCDNCEDSTIEVKVDVVNFRNVTADITNSGDAELENLHWNMTIKRDRLLNMRNINVSNQNTVADLPVENQTTAYTGNIGIYRFGFATVNVTVTADGIEPHYKTARAIIMGPMIITI